MRNLIFWTIAIIAAAWNLFGLFDFTMTVINYEPYLKNAPPEIMAWVHGLPGWRIALWGACVSLGAVAGLALLARRAIAVRIFWVTVALMIFAFGYDQTIGGARQLGNSYLIFSAVLILLEALFALYAGWAARQGMLKRP